MIPKTDPDEVAELLVTRVLNNKYIPTTPFLKQGVFLGLTCKEALYGGGAGGGKSEALLMAAMMWVDTPGYNAIIFRKTYSDLNLPGAIMDRSHEWLAGTDAVWNGSDYRWTFPSGATLTFGYLSHDKHKARYQSSEFQFVAFDELTHFPIEHYLYLFSRLRRTVDSDIPLRMRSGTNPGGIGHQWVYERFITPSSTRAFVPSLLSENPHLNQEEYNEALSELDETTRKQLQEGLWVTNQEGKPFRAEWYLRKNRFLPGVIGRDVGPRTRWISWDTALEDKDSSAYSVGVVLEVQPDYSVRVVDLMRKKLTFPDLPDAIMELYYKHERLGDVRGIIIEGQASGKPAIQTLRRSVDPKLASSIYEFNPKGDKHERASRAAVWAKRGLIHIPYPSVDNPWLENFEQELFAFPDTTYADQVDAFAQGVIYLENFLVIAWHGMEARRKVESGGDSRVTRAMKNHRAKNRGRV